MASFIISATVLFTLIFADFACADDDDGGINLSRDEWWHFKDQYSDRPRIFNQNKDCPAHRFYLDCNDCGCGPDGKPGVCTKRSCLEPPQIPNFRASEQDECPAGKRFYAKCNTCTCNENGRGAVCTRKECPDRSQK